MTRSPDYYILWLLVISLIAGNIWLGVKLGQTKHEITQALDQTSHALTEIGESKLPFSININEEVRFDAKINLKDGLKVPVKTVVPIDTVVDVPVSLPLVGATTIRVPIKTNVPITVDLDLIIDDDIPVDGTTNLSLAIPVSVKETPFGDLLHQISDILQNLNSSLVN